MKVLDISFSPISPEWVIDRRAVGWEALIVCAWTGGLAGNDGILANCANSLRTAREGGMFTAAYVNASPPDWWPLSVQMNHIRENIGSEWAMTRKLFMDVEIAGTTLERAAELADALMIEGKECEICYSARWFDEANGHIFSDPRWSQRFPNLWNAFYDADPDLDFASAPYGLWTIQDIIGEQYEGTVWLDGIQVDMSEFVINIWQEEDDEMTPEESAMLKDVHNWLLSIWDIGGLESRFIKAENDPTVYVLASKVAGYTTKRLELTRHSVSDNWTFLVLGGKPDHRNVIPVTPEQLQKIKLGAPLQSLL